MFEQIANRDLTEVDIPASDAEWHSIGEFALTFDGYAHWGNTCGEFANQCAMVFEEKGDLPDSLKDLRTCLFFEQRRYHHFGQSPDGRALAYIRALVEAIRHKVQMGETD